MDLLIFAAAAAASYWYETEMFLFAGSIYIMARFLLGWYRPLKTVWPPERGGAGRRVLAFLPFAAFAIMLVTLLTMASYDVVGIWVVFYITMGYAWLRGGICLLECFDLAWPFDTVHLENRAAVYPAAGGILGLTLIYAGANTGDGPGWWVVLFAAGLGLAGWLCLALLINLLTGISERISVDRDIRSGIRFGAYLIASSLILARASGGDWTSTQATLLEFRRGWPVIPLLIVFLIVEWFFMWRVQTLVSRDQESALPSVFWGFTYLAYGAFAVLLLPGLAESVFESLFGVIL